MERHHHQQDEGCSMRQDPAHFTGSPTGEALGVPLNIDNSFSGTATNHPPLYGSTTNATTLRTAGVIGVADGDTIRLK